MINPDDWHGMTVFERELLRHSRATATWTLLTFLAVVFAPALLVILSMLGY